jgi:hypothetical protein
MNGESSQRSTPKKPLTGENKREEYYKFYGEWRMLGGKLLAQSRLPMVEFCAIAFLLLSLSTLASLGGHIPEHPTALPNIGDLLLKPVTDLNQSGAGTTVVGGKKADTSDWEASLYPEATSESCSATLIGPKALLLAAHCVGAGKSVKWRKFGIDYSGPCTHSDAYGSTGKDVSADYALCLIGPSPSVKKFRQ